MEISGSNTHRQVNKAASEAYKQSLHKSWKQQYLFVSHRSLNVKHH